MSASQQVADDDNDIDDEPSLDDIEPGTIMVLHGLSKEELNGMLVEADKKIVSPDGTIRWNCIPLKDGDNASPISIKQTNLNPLPAPLASDFKKSEKLCIDGYSSFIKAREVGISKSKKYLDAAREKAATALNILPQSGLAFNLLGKYNVT